MSSAATMFDAVFASVCQTGSALSWLCAPICVFAQSGRPAASRRQFWVSLETRGRQAQSVVGTAVVEATGDLDAGQVAHMQAGIGLTEAAARAGFPSVGYVALLGALGVWRLACQRQVCPRQGRLRPARPGLEPFRRRASHPSRRGRRKRNGRGLMSWRKAWTQGQQPWTPHL